MGPDVTTEKAMSTTLTPDQLATYQAAANPLIASNAALDAAQRAAQAARVIYVAALLQLEQATGGAFSAHLDGVADDGKIIPGGCPNNLRMIVCQMLSRPFVPGQQ